MELAVRDSAIAGLGVFAASAIPKGAFIRAYNLVREVTREAPIDPAQGEAVAHCTYTGEGVFLVGFPDRHFNHSCDPNAMKRFAAGRIELYSRRRIEAGEEITHDYMVNTDGGDAWPCHCGAIRCRGETVSSYFDLPTAIQLENLPDLAEWFTRRHAERVEELRRKARRQRSAHRGT